MNKYLKITIGAIAGGIAGYTYYHFWGCTNGCPLQSNWLIMSAYGAFAGAVIMLPTKKKKDKITEEEKSNEA